MERFEEASKWEIAKERTLGAEGIAHLLRKQTHERSPQDLHRICAWLKSKQPELVKRVSTTGETTPHLLMLCAHIQYKWAFPGEVIIRQNDTSDMYYIIISGTCVVYFDHSESGKKKAKQEKGKEDTMTSVYGKNVDRLYEGHGFGESSLSDQRERRSATVVAARNDVFFYMAKINVKKEVELAVIMREDFFEVAQKSIDGYCLTPTYRLKDKIFHLKSSYLFNHWPSEDLMCLAYCFRAKSIEPQQHLYRYNKILSSIFIICTGEVKLSVPIKVQPCTTTRYSVNRCIEKNCEVCLLGPSSLFGYKRRIVNDRSYALENAISTMGTLCMSMSTSAFEEIMKKKRGFIVETRKKLEYLEKFNYAWRCVRFDIAKNNPLVKIVIMAKLQTPYVPCTRCGKLGHYSLQSGSCLTKFDPNKLGKTKEKQSSKSASELKASRRTRFLKQSECRTRTNSGLEDKVNALYAPISVDRNARKNTIKKSWKKLDQSIIDSYKDDDNFSASFTKKENRVALPELAIPFIRD